MPPKKVKSSAELKLADQVTDLQLDNHDLKGQIANYRERLVLCESGDESNLAPILPPAEQKIVMFIEGLLVRGLTPTEGYFLGRMMQAYGPARVERALQQKRASKEPIRAAYAMLNNGAQGKRADQKETQVPSVRWWTADDSYEAHGMES